MEKKNSSTISLIESGVSVTSSAELLEDSDQLPLTGLQEKQKGAMRKEDSFSKQALIDEADISATSDTESNVNINKPKQKGKARKPLAISDLLCLPNKDKALAQLYIEDKKTFDILEYSMFKELCEVFYIMVQHLAQQVMAAKTVDMKWEEELECFVKDAFFKAKKRWQSICSSVMEGNDLHIPDTLQVDLRSISVHLIEYVCKTLEDCDGAVDNEEVVSSVLHEFQNNWATFERLQAETNLKQVKQLEKDIMLRKQIIVLLYDEKAELVNKLLQYKDKQLAQLDTIQHDIHSEKLQRIRTEVDDTWEYILNSFDMELRKQSYCLSLQLQTQLSSEEEQGVQLLERSIDEKKEALAKGQLSLSDFVTDYCDLTRAFVKGKTARKSLELKLIGSHFSTLVENSGVKILKTALETEKRLYTDLLQRTNWITPHVSQCIHGNLVRLKGLKESLKTLRGKQRATLQAMVKRKAAEEVSEKTFCGTAITHQQKSLKEVIDEQTDLCERECQHLVDHCTARLKMFEVQLELSKLRQERRLQEVVEIRMDQLRYNLRKETEGILSANEVVVLANMRFQKDEANLRSLHESAFAELKRKLEEETRSTLLSEHLIFQKQIEKLRRKQERNISLANKKEIAINALKSKLLNKLSDSKDKDTGDQILHKHQADTELLTQTITKTKDYQSQVLTQKLQARKLEKKQEKERELKQQQPPQLPYRPGSAKAFVSTALVSWLYEVRHKRATAALEAELEQGEKMMKVKMAKRFQADAKLELQVHETEVIVKLASALNMTHSELENELRKSVLEQSGSTDQETYSMVTKSVLDLLSHAY